MSESFNGKFISDVLVRRSQQTQKENLISWSRQGHIAYALHNSQQTTANLFITYLECLDGKHWQLAPPTSFKVLSFGLENVLTNTSSVVVNNSTQSLPAIKYVSFSNTGWDLFTADENGNISILVTGIKKVIHNDRSESNNSQPGSGTTSAISQYPLSQFSRTSFNTAEIFYSDGTSIPLPDLSSSEKRKLNQVVSMKWLHIDKPVISNSPAVRIQQSPESQVLNGCASKMGAASDDAAGFYYRYNAHQYKSYGTMHPLATKQACIIIRKNGEVSLLHQEDHGIEYKKISAMLEKENNETDILTASIGFEREGKIIIATYDNLTNSLKFYAIIIDWGYLQTAAKQLAEVPNYRVPDSERIAPKLIIEKLFIKPLESNLKGFNFSSIHLISPNYHQSTSLEILLTFEKERTFANDKIQTTIIRYNLENVKLADCIHQGFKDIASRRNNSTSIDQTMYQLKQKQILNFNESILSLESLNLDMLIVLKFADGSIKTVDRNTFLSVTNQYSSELKDNTMGPVLLPSSISSLFEAGFEFPSIKHQPEYSCISPNICAYVTLQHNESQLRVFCATTDSVDAIYYQNNRKGLLFATAAAVALRHTTACYFGYFTDDLIATVINEIDAVSEKVDDSYSYRLMISILQEAQRAINLNIDISPEQSDKMSQNQPLQRLLTLQLSLGTSENWNRTRSGKIAFALVNLRFVASSVMYTIHTIYSNMQRFARKGLTTHDTLLNATMREDCILSVLGIIRWCLDYVVMLSQELLELGNAFKKNDPELLEKLMKESIVVPLILGKIPRAFLLFSISNIRRLFSFIQKFVEKNDTTLTSLITPENPMGAFKVVEKKFLNDDTPSLLNNVNSISGPKTGVNSKTARSIVSQPTVEAYYRLGSMMDRLPISIVAFEKFIAEADGPLRNIKLDAPMSLAIEQQIVCQGYISKTFIEAMKKLCEVFDRSVLNYPGTRLDDLYFYDISWLGMDILSENDKDEEMREQDEFFGLDTDESKQISDFNLKLESPDFSRSKNAKKRKFHSILIDKTDILKSRRCYSKLVYKNSYDGLILDSLRKQLIKPIDLIDYYQEIHTNKLHMVNQGSPVGDAKLVLGDDGIVQKLLIRKCIRCGAISTVHDELPFVPNTIGFVTNPVFQHYQRICICGGSWANV